MDASQLPQLCNLPSRIFGNTSKKTGPASPASSTSTSKNTAAKAPICSNLADLQDLVGKSYKEDVPLLQLLSNADAAGNLKSDHVYVLKNVVLTELDDGTNYYEVPPHIELHGTIDGAVHVGLYRGGLKANHPDAAAITIAKDKVSIEKYDLSKPAACVPTDQILEIPVLSFSTEQNQPQQQLSLLNQRRNEALRLSIQTLGEALRKASTSTSNSSATNYQAQLKWLESMDTYPEAAYQLWLIQLEGKLVESNKEKIRNYARIAITAGHQAALLLSEAQPEKQGFVTGPRTYYQLYKLYSDGGIGVTANFEKAEKYLITYSKLSVTEAPLQIVNGEFRDDTSAVTRANRRAPSGIGLLKRQWCSQRPGERNKAPPLCC